MAADEPGAALSSKYKLLRSLGAGGMGSVYLARDITLNRDVAIKFIALSKADDATARRRLVREAQAAAALDHPFICSVHEVSTDTDGQPYIVMQFVEGETLADRLRRGPLDPRAALTLTADIADALRAAHAQGVIHRDLKPQNIIMTPSGRPKLLDFGIAHILQTTTPAIGGDEPTHTNLTGPNQVIGTPGYMSPEQLQQRPVDGRSDLFALGAVLFECLTGRPAFPGRTSIEIGGHVLMSEAPVVSSLRPELTARHDEIVSRLLAKDPSSRFQSAEELLGALRVLAPSDTHTVLAATTPSTRHFAVAATLAILVREWAFGSGSAGRLFLSRPRRHGNGISAEPNRYETVPTTADVWRSKKPCDSSPRIHRPSRDWLKPTASSMRSARRRTPCCASPKCFPIGRASTRTKA